MLTLFISCYGECHVGNMTYGHRETWYRSVSVFESSQVRILLARVEKLET